VRPQACLLRQAERRVADTLTTLDVEEPDYRPDDGADDLVGRGGCGEASVYLDVVDGELARRLIEDWPVPKSSRERPDAEVF